MRKNSAKNAADRRSALYTLEGNPGIFKTLPHAIQQVFAMFVSNLVPLGIIAAAAAPTLSQEEIYALMQSALVAAGIATIIQATPIWKLGAGLPIFMGISFTFVVPLSAIAAKYGFGVVTGTVLAGGLFEGILGLTVRYWRRIMAPIVSAVVVTGISISLLSTATRSFGGGYVEDFGSLPNIIIGTATMMGSILWMALVKGSKKQLAVLIGIVAGYITALLYGKVDFSALRGVGWFALPKLLPYKPIFRLDAIISVAIIYLVSATETLGDASAITGGLLHRPLTKEEMTGALTIDGFGSFISGLLGGTPVTSYSQNVGLTIMTGVVNRNVARAGGAILIVSGLFPPVSRIFGTIPEPVIGGMFLIVMGQIMASGFEMIAEAGFTARNKLITAISLSVAIGFTGSTEAGLWSNFPVAIQSIFAQNVVAVIFVLALVLNLVLPKNMED